MGILKIDINEFLLLSRNNFVFDVRSPGEFFHAHIPGALSLPLFSDDERAVVGTAYKQQSRSVAIKLGLDFFGLKMRKIIEEVEEKTKGKKGPEIGSPIFVHCWRGGMRSAAIAWLLDLYGFKVYTLAGGYKSYRKWVLEQCNKEYQFKIIGGFTGSGKTPLLKQLESFGEKIIDLEGLANHKGSAFGALGEQPQPSQEMFENLLANELFSKSGAKQKEESEAPWILLEDESQRIGRLTVPIHIWNVMRLSPLIFVKIDFEARLRYLVETYGSYDKESLVAGITRIQKRLGGLETKTAINFILEDDHAECFKILLKYYDRLYTKGLNNRNGLTELLQYADCNEVDPLSNGDQIKKILAITSSMKQYSA